jgi:hypothetical protein
MLLKSTTAPADQSAQSSTPSEEPTSILARYQPPADEAARSYFANAHLAPHHTLPAGSTVFVMIVTPYKYARWCEWFDTGANASCVYKFALHQCAAGLKKDFLLYRNPPGTRPWRSYKQFIARVRALGDDARFKSTDLHTLDIMPPGSRSQKRWLDPAVALHRQVDGGQRLTLLLISHDLIEI